MCGHLSFSTVSSVGPNIEMIVVVVAFPYSGQHYHPNIQTFMHFNLYTALFMGISAHKCSHKCHSIEHHDDNNNPDDDDGTDKIFLNRKAESNFVYRWKYTCAYVYNMHFGQQKHTHAYIPNSIYVCRPKMSMINIK